MTRGLWLGFMVGLLLLGAQRVRRLATLVRVVGIAAGAIIVVGVAMTALTKGAIWVEARERLELAGSGIAKLVHGGDHHIALPSSLDPSDHNVSELLRLAQLQPLIDAWQQAPWLGKGFGATASIVRSEEFPFSFELVPLELLLKLGVIGLGGAIVLLCIISWRCLKAAPHANAYSAAALAAVLTTSMTNPMLFTSVGMAIVMLIFWDMGARAQQHLER
jgi:O-antigen ligase